MGSSAYNKMSIDDIDVKGKRVLVRLDLNVPFENGEISDLNRINASVPTVKKLVDEGAKVIICSHLGKEDKHLSLEKVCKKFSEVLGKDIKFLNSERVVDDTVREYVKNMKDGEIAMLENTRFRPEETKNGDDFSQELASLCDVFVSDAFGTVHRAHASNVGVSKYVPVTVCGYLIKEELDKLCKMIENPKKPFVTILGGAKIADKLKVIEKAIEKSNKVILGGGMVYTFLKGMGYEVGKSLVDDSQISYCMDMINKAKKSRTKLILPVDIVCTKNFPDPITNTKIDTITFPAKKIDKDYMGLDIGEKSIRNIIKELKGAKTVLWNGPVGLFENQKFALGTYSIARIMSDMKDANTIIGGGDSASAVNKFNLAHKMTHVSTGGGASLEFLKGEPLPGVECINDK